MPAGNSDRICHGQNSETECEGDPEQADANLRNGGASTALPQPPRTSQHVPRNSAQSFLNMKFSRNPLHGGLTVADARTLYLHQFRFREQPLFCECIELRLRCKEALQRDPF